MSPTRESQDTADYIELTWLLCDWEQLEWSDGDTLFVLRAGRRAAPATDCRLFISCFRPSILSARVSL